MDAAWDAASAGSTRQTRTAAGAARRRSGLDPRDRQPSAADDEDLQPDGRRRGSRARARSHPPPDRDEPRATRRRPRRPVPRARVRPGDAVRRVRRRVRAARRGGHDRRLRRLELRRRAARGGRARRPGRPSLVQNSYSLLERGDEDGVLPLCTEHGLDYQAFSPLAGGWLTGKYRPGEAHPEGSRMTLRPGPYAPSRRRARPPRRRTPRRARRSGDARARVGDLDTRPSSSAVVGPRRPEHLEPALAARDLDLSPGERDEIASFFA